MVAVERRPGGGPVGVVEPERAGLGVAQRALDLSAASAMGASLPHPWKASAPNGVAATRRAPTRRAPPPTPKDLP